jgi:hypothetical protein
MPSIGCSKRRVQCIQGRARAAKAQPIRALLARSFRWSCDRIWPLSALELRAFNGEFTAESGHQKRLVLRLAIEPKFRHHAVLILRGDVNRAVWDEPDVRRNGGEYE